MRWLGHDECLRAFIMLFWILALNKYQDIFTHIHTHSRTRSEINQIKSRVKYTQWLIKMKRIHGVFFSLLLVLLLFATFLMVSHPFVKNGVHCRVNKNGREKPNTNTNTHRALRKSAKSNFNTIAEESDFREYVFFSLSPFFPFSSLCQFVFVNIQFDGRIEKMKSVIKDNRTAYARFCLLPIFNYSISNCVGFRVNFRMNEKKNISSVHDPMFSSSLNLHLLSWIINSILRAIDVVQIYVNGLIPADNSCLLQTNSAISITEN